MVTLKCSQCGSNNLTTNTICDVKCKNCDDEFYTENSILEDLDFIYIVHESGFNTDKPRAQDVSPSIHLATPSYDKAKGKLREVGNDYDLEDWDIEDLEKYDHFEYRDGFYYTFCSIKKIKLS